MIQSSHDFLNPDTGEWEKIETTRWRWSIEYDNGYILQQYNDQNGYFHRFSEVDISKAKIFRLYSPFYHHSFTIRINPSFMEPVYFLKHYGSLTVNTDGSMNEKRIMYYVFGYNNILTGEKVYLTIDESGNLMIDNTSF